LAINLPFCQYAKVEKINSSYKIVEYEKQLSKVRSLKAKIKTQSTKETAEMKKEFIAKNANNKTKDPKELFASFKVDESKFSTQYRKLMEEFAQETKNLEMLQRRMTATNRSEYFNGICYVTFETKQMADRVIELVGTKDGMFSKLLFCVNKRRIVMNERTTFTLKAAQSPSDINWQNLGTGVGETVCRRFGTFSLSLVLLGISFFSQLGLKILQRNMRKEMLQNKSLSFSSLSFRIISVGVTVIILVINTAISMALRKLTLYEKHTTNTTFFRSLTFKIALTQFVNTNILPVIVHVILFYPEYPLYAKGGLMNDALFILISQIIVTPLMNLLNIWYFMRKMKQSSLRKQLANGGGDNITQLEAHAIFENPVWDPASCYAGIVKDLMTCIFFQPLLPISGFMGMISTFLMYWSQKIRFTRMSVRPITISTPIASTILYFISISPLVYGISSMIFDKLLYDKIHLISIGYFVVGCICLLVPYYKPLGRCLGAACLRKGKNMTEKNAGLPYKDFRTKFMTEYDRANPVTSEKAMKEYFDYLSNKFKNPEERKLNANNILLGMMRQGEQKRAFYGDEQSAMIALPPGFFGGDIGGGQHIAGGIQPNMFNFFNNQLLGDLDPFTLAAFDAQSRNMFGADPSTPGGIFGNLMGPPLIPLQDTPSFNPGSISPPGPPLPPGFNQNVPPSPSNASMAANPLLNMASVGNTVKLTDININPSPSIPSSPTGNFYNFDRYASLKNTPPLFVPGPGSQPTFQLQPTQVQENPNYRSPYVNYSNASFNAEPQNHHPPRNMNSFKGLDQQDNSMAELMSLKNLGQPAGNNNVLPPNFAPQQNFGMFNQPSIGANGYSQNSYPPAPNDIGMGMQQPAMIQNPNFMYNSVQPQQDAGIGMMQPGMPMPGRFEDLY